MADELLIEKWPHARDIPLPSRMTELAAGFDLYTAIKSDIILLPGERTLVGTGISIALPPAYEAQIRPRSGLARKVGLSLLNSPGTIDADYRGEIKLIVVNHGERPIRLKRGQRIAQMVISRVERIPIAEKDKLSSTTRGCGGFGHTGC